MEGSIRGKRSREKGLTTPDPHVDEWNGKKTIVYNTKKEKKGGHTEKRLEKKERERAKRLKKYNSKKEEFSTPSHSTRACLRILSAYICV